MPFTKAFKPRTTRTTRFYKKKSTVSRKGKYLPSRVRFSRKRYVDTKQISRSLSNLAENKFSGFTGNCLEPVAKPAGSQPISYLFYNAGHNLGLSLPEFNPMNLWRYARGDTNLSRDGDYMYVKKSGIKMEIQMLPYSDVASQLTSQTAVEFRVMVVKANRKYNPLATFSDPGTNLFLTNANGNFGYDGTTESVHTNFQQPINKCQWLVYCDKRFTLTPPSVDDIALGGERINTARQNLPTKKYININLPCWKKCHFTNASGDAVNTPDNFDGQFLVILQAVRASYCLDDTRRPENWRVNMIGSTQASDM